MTERRALTGAEIRVLLGKVGQRLVDVDLTATVLVVGGAAIALTLETRDSTTDVDAIARDATEVYAIAGEVEAEHGEMPSDDDLLIDATEITREAAER